MPLSEELLRIEKEINEKVRTMGEAQEFFGEGHGLNVAMLMSCWVEQENLLYECRLRVKLDYTVRCLPEGRITLVVKGESRPALRFDDFSILWYGSLGQGRSRTD